MLNNSVTTSGAASPAIVAQSIGGGGGLATFYNPSDVSTGSATLGAMGGSGSASTATINNNAAVSTSGIASIALLAQSIGGGGGAALAVGVQGFSSVSLGKSGGTSADGGNVAITNTAAVTTSGAFAHGLVAQSIGGGGGLLTGTTASGASSAFAVSAASSNPGGNGGTVQVSTTADITTSGEGAHAIIAQSIGGGGGLVGGGSFETTLPASGSFAGSVGGNGTAAGITINLQANVAATGKNADGVFAQSVDLGGRGGDISLVLSPNKSLSGGDGGFAIRFDGGNNNTIKNFGIINGSMDLGSASTTLTNATNATLNLGAIANLGAGGLLNNAGIVSPGGSNTAVATTFTGNFNQSSAGLYAVDVKPAVADSLNISGKASLDGNVLATFSSGSGWKNKYNILHASGGVTGAFATLGTINLPTSFKSSLSQTDSDVYLQLISTLGSNTGTQLPPSGQSITSAINTWFNNGGGTLPAGFGSLFNLNGPALSNALTQLTGEPSTNGGQQSGVKLSNSFMSLLLNGFVSNRDAMGGVGAAGLAPSALGYAAVPRISDEDAAAFVALERFANVRPTSGERWNVWGSVYGGQANAAADTSVGSNSTRTQSVGMATGFDYRFSPDSMVGFALAGGGTSWNSAGGLGGGTSDVFQLGVYGSHQFGASYVSASAAYAFYNMNTNRTVTIAGTDRLSASFGANNIGSRIETGHRFELPFSVGLTPFAAGQVQQFFMPNYRESAVSGSDQFALTYGARKSTTARGELGIWLDTNHTIGSIPTKIFARLAMAHDWKDNGSATAYFQSLPGSSFNINGVAAPKNLELVTMGAEFQLSKSAAFSTKFDGEFAPRFQSYAGTATLRLGW